MRQLKCDSCGANIAVEEEKDFGFCPYCRAKYVINEKVNVNVVFDNKNSEKIKSANNYIKEGNFEKAEKIFKNVLEDDDSAHEAWWGRYLCEQYYAAYYGYTNRYGETSINIKKQIIEKYLYFAYRAIETAPDDVAKFYKEQILDEENFIKG